MPFPSLVNMKNDPQASKGKYITNINYKNTDSTTMSIDFDTGNSMTKKIMKSGLCFSFFGKVA